VNRFPFVFGPFSIQEIKNKKEWNRQRQHSRKEKYDGITHVCSPPSPIQGHGSLEQETHDKGDERNSSLKYIH
jgi:hypothetical protein